MTVKSRLTAKIEKETGRTVVELVSNRPGWLERSVGVYSWYARLDTDAIVGSQFTMTECLKAERWDLEHDLPYVTAIIPAGFGE